MMKFFLSSEEKKAPMALPSTPELNPLENNESARKIIVESEGYEEKFNEELKHILVPNLIKKTGFEKIMEVSSLVLRQKSEAKEILTGCETNIVYYISSSLTESANPGKRLFKAREFSTCFQTHFMRQECRPLKMHVSNIIDSETNEEKPFLVISKETTGTCLKWKRPHLTITDDKENHLGSLKSSFEGICGGFSLEVHAGNDLKYLIRTSGIQWSFCCPLPCKQCEKVYFNIINPKADDSDPAKNAGMIVKNLVCCKKAVLTDNEFLMVSFPKESNQLERALLLAALLYIEFTLFSISSPGINS